MGLFDQTLTAGDFADADWEAVVTASPMKDCFAYTSMFQGKAEEARANGNTKQEAVFGLLSFITSFSLRIDSIREPLSPRMEMHVVPTPTLDDIPDAYLEALKEIAPTISDAELQARVTDILWIRQKGKAYPMVKLAIQAYLKAAEVLDATGYESRSSDRVERALQLASSLGKNPPELHQVIQHLEGLITTYTINKQWPRAARMQELLIIQKRGDPKTYAPLAEAAARQMEAEEKWHLAERFWQIKANWHVLAGEEDEERVARIQAAETHVKQVEHYLSLPSPNYIQATHHVKDAIEAFRTFGGNKERVRQLHSQLLQFQPNLTGQLGFRKNETPDISAFESYGIAAVTGKTLLDAFYSLATLMKPPSAKFLRKSIEDKIGNYLLYYMFEVARMDASGKVVARRPSFSPEDKDAKELAVLSEMYTYAYQHRSSLAMALVEPAREQIKLEHGVRVRDFYPIVFNNRFVPPGHEQIYAEGLYAGLVGDFLTACHLLAPQLENSIRYILNQQDAITSSYTSKRIQDEDSLNMILELPELRQVLDEDTIFDLKGLLAEQFGSNLRNEMAHGLMTYNEFWSAQVSYLWWMALRLCCLFRIVPSLVPKATRKHRVDRFSKRRSRYRGRNW